MLESIPFALLLSTALGFLSGIGIGGGSLLILWLTLVLNMDPQTARSINLLFFIPSALIACIFRWRQGNFHIKRALPAVLAGCLAAGAFSWIGIMVDTALLRKLFGGLLLITGIREVLYKPRCLGGN